VGSVRVAIDIGGTFTDVCVLDAANGQVRVAKTPTTPDPIDGFMNGLAAAGVALPDVALLSHGTTVATNALITRRLPRVAMVCTRGFRDVRNPSCQQGRSVGRLQGRCSPLHSATRSPAGYRTH
jgi:N-methylhydantoinase A